jgi:serine/threonine protein phosphatase PrpC
MAQQELGRSPTFIVGTDIQQGKLDVLVRREQHFSEQYSKNKPLCFNAKAFQKTHPKKAAIAKRLGRKDADATLVSPMLVAIADGVSQIEDFGIDASELPNELLNSVEEAAIAQLLPGQETEDYLGPISMMREAYQSTTCQGSTTVLTATMDNSTRIHGKLHPMIAICSIGDCEILVLRRTPEGRLTPAFHTEMQRVDGNAQCPLQLARVDETIDPNFDPVTMIEVIERGSAVHCVSAYEGDIVVLGTDGVFDNLFIDEVVGICDQILFSPNGPGQKFRPLDRSVLGQCAKRIVTACHEKTQPGMDGYVNCPIGKGGKVDDTSCVVGEVVEWTDKHGEAWANLRRRQWFKNVFTCGGALPSADDEIVLEDKYEYGTGARVRNYPTKPNASFSTYWGSFSEYSGGSFASFSSLASGWGKAKEPAYAMYGARPQQDELRSRFNRNREEESDDDEDTQCSIM